MWVRCINSISSLMAPRGTTPCFLQVSRVFGAPSWQRDLSLHLGVGSLKLFIKIGGNVFYLAAFHFNPEFPSYTSSFMGSLIL